MTSQAAAPRPLWLFLHLPKTGGTTFTAHLGNHLEWDEELIEFSYWGRRFRAEAGRRKFAERSESHRNRALVLAGHHLRYGDHRLVPHREARYVTFVRDPAHRCVSLYNFRRSRGKIGLDFETWYSQVFLATDRQAMVDFYASRLVPEQMLGDIEQRTVLACKLLERCWHVGDTGNLSYSLGLLSRAIGVPDDWTNARVAGSGIPLDATSHPDRGEVVERHVELNDTLKNRIHADCRHDLALFRWATGRSAAFPYAYLAGRAFEPSEGA